MDYSKLPRIDLSQIDNSMFKNIFRCEYREPFMMHIIKYENKDILLGHALLKVNHKNETISWETFYPFSRIISDEEIIRRMEKEPLDTKILDEIKRIKHENPQSKEYSIIDSIRDEFNKELLIVPAGFIKNYERKGIGSLAHTRILEEILKIYGSKITNYDVMHSTANTDRIKHLNAMKLKQGRKENHFKEFLGIETKEPYKSYIEKSVTYLKSRGIY